MCKRGARIEDLIKKHFMERNTSILLIPIKNIISHLLFPLLVLTRISGRFGQCPCPLLAVVGVGFVWIPRSLPEFCRDPVSPWFGVSKSYMVIGGVRVTTPLRPSPWSRKSDTHDPLCNHCNRKTNKSGIYTTPFGRWKCPHRDPKNIDTHSSPNSFLFPIGVWPCPYMYEPLY